MENIVYTGSIKMFNNKYGFIKYDKGEIFFHKRHIKNDAFLKPHDKVCFRIAESKLKEGSVQAVDVNLLAKDAVYKQSELLQLPKYFGYIEWYSDKGFGCISSNNEEFFFHDSAVRTKFLDIEEHEHVSVFFNKRDSRKHKGQEEACDVLLINYHPLDELLIQTIKQSIADTGFIDTQSKYISLKTLLEIFKSKGKMLPLTDLKVDEQFHFQLWKDGFISEVNHALVVEKIGDINNYRDFVKLFEHAFNQIKENAFQEEILGGLVYKLGKIDSDLKFNKVRTVLGSEKINGEAKTNFCDAVLDECDREKKYSLWLHGYTERNDLDYVAERLFKNITSEAYQKVFNRLREVSSQIILLEKLNDKIGEIDNHKKYQDVKIIFDGSSLPNYSSTQLRELAARFISYIYKNILHEQDSSKTELNYNNQIDDILNAGHRTELLVDFFECHYTHKLFDISWLIALLYNFSVPERLKVLYCISEILLIKPGKNKYKGTPIIKLITSGEISYIFNNLNLYPKQFLESIRSLCAIKQTGSSFRYHQSSLYVKRVNAIHAILKSKLIPHDSVETYYTKQHTLNIQNDIKHIRAYNELLDINEIVIDFEFITTVIEHQGEEIATQLSGLDNDELTELLKDVKYLSESSLKLLLEPLLKKISLDSKLKLWVHDLSEYFDFNSFCSYYFTLNAVERSEFNKKVKATMGKILKHSMLKEREPWMLSHVEEETEVFTATWKSIWFQDKHIRFCIDTDGSFSTNFKLEFSETNFNFLFEYIAGRKLSNLTVYVKHNIIQKVDGLDELEEIIWKAQIDKEIKTGDSVGLKSLSLSKIPVNILLRNQCIQLLSRLQLHGLEPTHVLEKTFDKSTGGSSFDYSLLFSIPLPTKDIAVIWESLELEKSKATHIFKCTSEDYGGVFVEIEQHLQLPKVRSVLNSSDPNSVSIQNKLRYLSRVDHNNFDFSRWEDELYNVLPELREISAELMV